MNGATPLEVADVPGVVVAGVTVDAGLDESPVLLRWVALRPGLGLGGEPDDAVRRVLPGRRAAHRPGLHCAEVNSDHVLIETPGSGGPTTGSRASPTPSGGPPHGRNGVVANGDHVTANGLFVEHFQQYNTVWNGDDGSTILYQNDCPTTRRRRPTG